MWNEDTQQDDLHSARPQRMHHGYGPWRGENFVLALNVYMLFVYREVNQPPLDLTASPLRKVREGGQREVRIKTRGQKLKSRKHR